MSDYFSDNVIEAGHGGRSLRSGAVSLVARAVNAVIQIGSVLFLARLLSPEDYGLVSMVTAVTAFAPGFVDLGTRDAVVQRTRITEGEVSALFWITMACGCSCALLVGASGPLIARFYGEPRLTMITLVAAVTFITSALTCQHAGLLRRTMRFKELGAIEVAANLLSAGGAIAVALFGFRYWALVLRPVATTTFLAIGTWMRCRWWPPRPTFTPGVKEMLKFGLNLSGFTVTDQAGKSSDKIAIGYQSGARALGYYQNAAFVYENLMDVLVLPLHQVAVAGLSKMREDLPELRRLWAKALGTLSFYAMPAFGILAVTSQDLIVPLLGAKWTSAGVLLSVLALRGIPQTVERTLGWLHVTTGRTDRWMRWGVFATAVQLVALFAGLPYGPSGVAVAFVIYTLILCVPAIAYAGRPLGIHATDVIAVVWRPFVGSVTAVAIGFLLRSTLLSNSAGFVRIVLQALAYGTVYLGLVVGVFRLRAPIGVILNLVRGFLPARFARHVRTPRFIEAEGYEHL